MQSQRSIWNEVSADLCATTPTELFTHGFNSDSEPSATVSGACCGPSNHNRYRGGDRSPSALRECAASATWFHRDSHDYADDIAVAIASATGPLTKANFIDETSRRRNNLGMKSVYFPLILMALASFSLGSCASRPQQSTTSERWKGQAADSAAGAPRLHGTASNPHY